MNLNSPISSIKGIGAKTEQLFHNLGVYTCGDILLHYPRDYQKLPPLYGVHEVHEGVSSGELKEGQTIALSGRIGNAPTVRRTRNLEITSLFLRVGTLGFSLVWFRMPYLKSTLKQGGTYVFLGKLVQKGKNLSMDQPEIYLPEKYISMENSLWPSYALTKGLSKNLLSKTIRQVLKELDLSKDYLLEDIRSRHHLAEYNFAVENIHFPVNETSLLEARKRLVFDEFFRFVLAARLQKQQMEQVENQFIFPSIDTAKNQEESWANQVMEQLPYELTNAQIRTLDEVRHDLRGPQIMQRLIQGDVGSGKTILAFLAMLDCVQGGYQSALMAPTEVLARQHYENFTTMCERYGLEIPVLLLTGSMTSKEKRRAYDRIQLYSKAIIIGTHALIQEKAIFDNLALVITDEQHRFGVKQRESLFLKGYSPHVLVMSATPIPRTLAIILYGDLDISVIDEVPATRLPIKNAVVGKEFRPRTYRFIEEEVKKSRQAYVICPLVEESEGLEAENVVSYSKMLADQLPDVVVTPLHGKMRPALKNKIMEEFAAGKIQVLVSTTVIEVGINVPNATVMVVEDAQRFGLAQLHQLRGRVGRGEHQSYCILIDTSQKPEANERLEILTKSNDGFFIASEDLKLRGPGDFFGIRQSGLLEFRLGDIYRDGEILKIASEEAKNLLTDDKDLSHNKNQSIHLHVVQYLDECARIANL